MVIGNVRFEVVFIFSVCVIVINYSFIFYFYFRVRWKCGAGVGGSGRKGVEEGRGGRFYWVWFLLGFRLWGIWSC